MAGLTTILLVAPPAWGKTRLTREWISSLSPTEAAAVEVYESPNTATKGLRIFVDGPHAHPALHGLEVAARKLGLRWPANGDIHHEHNVRSRAGGMRAERKHGPEPQARNLFRRDPSPTGAQVQ